MLVLDAGSSLLGEYPALKSEGRVMIEGMNRSQYDAMTLGRMDGLLGLDVIKARAAEAEFPILAANLLDAETGELAFGDKIIVEQAGMTIGIIGVTDEEIAEAPKMKGAVTFLDPQETVAAYVAEMRDQVDVLIVLSHLGLGVDDIIARQVDGIDIIVGGKSRKLMRQPELVNDTIIVQMGYNGERVGQLDVILGEDGKLYEPNLQLLTLDESYPEDREMELILQEYRKQYPTPTPRPRPTLTPTPAK